MTSFVKVNIRLHVNEITQVIINVYYVPKLTNNLISIKKLIEKGVFMLIQVENIVSIIQRKSYFGKQLCQKIEFLYFMLQDYYTR